MKICTVVLMSTFIAAISATVANAQTQRYTQPTGEADLQMQRERQACEGDVYALCNDAIPDVGRITACLRLHWKEVSHQCRAIMASHSRHHNVRRSQ